jgi:hypothetical protein
VSETFSQSKKDLIQWLEASAPQTDPDGESPKLYKTPGDRLGAPIPPGLNASDTRSLRAALAREATEVIELSTHSKAKSALLKALYSDSPFLLFLRSFDSEARDYPTLVTSYETDKRRHVNLLDMIPSDYPIIGIRNKADLFDRNPVPSLDAKDEEWFSVVSDLIVNAAYILVSIRGASKGIFDEIGMITYLGKSSKTTIVEAEPPTNVEIQVSKFAALVTGRSPYQPLSDDDHDFLREHNFFVVTESELRSRPDVLGESIRDRSEGRTS